MEALLQDAAALLQSSGDKSIALSAPAVLKEQRNRIVRCTLKSAARPPRSIIIKQIIEQPECGYSDWASLEFLSTLHALDGTAPKFIAGNAEKAFFIMEDFGPGQTIEHELSGGTEWSASQALAEFAGVLARLHLATANKEDAFLKFRGALPAMESHGRGSEADQWLAAQPKVIRWLDKFHIPHGHLVAPIKEIAKRYRHPGKYLAMTHGDVAPANNHCNRGEVRLLDFEYGAFRHMYYDMSAWDILCPLPAKVANELRAAYRGAIGLGRTPGENFRREWATMVLYRGLAMLSWIGLEILEAETQWVGQWSKRSCVIGTSARIAAAARDSEQKLFEPLSDAFDALSKKLRQRWPEIKHDSPQWPAFTEK